MTKTVKTTLFFFVALLVLCGGVIASLVAKNNSSQKQNEQLQSQNEQYQNSRFFLENCYEKALMELADSLDNMQANLSKLHASNGVENQHLLITKIVSEAQTAESDLGSLPIDNQVLKKVAEFANKTSDYCLQLQEP